MVQPATIFRASALQGVCCKCIGNATSSSLPNRTRWTQTQTRPAGCSDYYVPVYNRRCHISTLHWVWRNLGCSSSRAWVLRWHHRKLVRLQSCCVGNFLVKLHFLILYPVPTLPCNEWWPCVPLSCCQSNLGISAKKASQEQLALKYPHSSSWNICVSPILSIWCVLATQLAKDLLNDGKNACQHTFAKNTFYILT